MEAVTQVPPQVWLVFHVVGVALALSSRCHATPGCVFGTNVLLAASTLVVGGVAAVGFLCQQPFWAASGCTLGVMAVAAVFERGSNEPGAILRAVALEDLKK